MQNEVGKKKGCDSLMKYNFTTLPYGLQPVTVWGALLYMLSHLILTSAYEVNKV